MPGGQCLPASQSLGILEASIQGVAQSCCLLNIRLSWPGHLREPVVETGSASLRAMQGTLNLCDPWLQQQHSDCPNCR